MATLLKKFMSLEKKKILDCYVGLRIQSGELEALDNIARQYGEKRGSVIRLALREYLSKLANPVEFGDKRREMLLSLPEA